MRQLISARSGGERHYGDPREGLFSPNRVFWVPSLVFCFYSAELAVSLVFRFYSAERTVLTSHCSGPCWACLRCCESLLFLATSICPTPPLGIGHGGVRSHRASYIADRQTERKTTTRTMCAAIVHVEDGGFHWSGMPA